MIERPSQWISALQQGNEQAAEQLWKDCFSKALRLAKKRMAGLRLRAVDEEDIAISAMNSFCNMAKKERENPIADLAELWKILATIINRKVGKERQRQYAGKRQEYRLAGESGVSPAYADQGEVPLGLDQFAGRETPPELLVELEETLQWFRDLPGITNELLPLKAAGYSNREIAEKLGCSTRTVQRSIEKIKKAWEHLQEQDTEEWEKENFPPPMLPLEKE